SFTKVGADGTTPLTGVKFTLYPLLPPDPGVEGSTEQPDMANPITAISADGSDSTIPAGFVDFGGLKSGDYQLVETQTVPGYALPAGSWKITINAAATGVGADQSVKIIVFEGMPMAFMETKTIREDGTTATALAVRNYLQQVLPITGGIGSIPFVISGVGLIGVSIILSFSIKDKKNKRSRA
ncbi:MAG: prealbumin-like fold domain-containing protein, partial [Firmicutes bacterium]|nr:prealbumin-like fold domain-containing protein [Bacillota bacterium]